MTDRRVRRAVCSVFLASMMLLMTASSVAADDPYYTVSHFAGYMPLAVAWNAEAPEVGCVIVEGTPAPITPKTCGGIRFSGGVNGEVSFDVADGVETVIVELAWVDVVPGTRLQLDTMCADVPRGPSGAVLDPEHACYAATSGPSGIQIRMDADAWEGGAFDPVGTWAARVFADTATGSNGVGVAWEQTYDIYVSVFYGDAAPEEYSAIP